MYLQIKQINKSYSSKQVVSNVDLMMEQGEILAARAIRLWKDDHTENDCWTYHA